MTEKLPSSELRSGRRALDGIQECRLLSPLTWKVDHYKWHFKCRLKSIGSALIPKESDWDVFIEDTYPWGDIKFFPSATNSIEVTFPHQSFNFPASKPSSWRLGNPCLNTDVASLNRVDIDSEPTLAGARLLWQVRRLLKWLELAAAGSLLASGDPFEIPVFPSSPKAGLSMVFDEGRESFDFWKDKYAQSGRCELFPYRKITPLSAKSNIYILWRHETEDGKVKEVTWGNFLERRYNEKEVIVAPWILLSRVPTTVAWQTPITWQELSGICARDGINLFQIIADHLDELREQKQRVLLLGMPIPGRLGEENLQVHWQAIHIPSLSPSGSVPKGFRPNRYGFHYRDIQDLAAIEKARCNWIISENWNKKEVTTRGVLDTQTHSFKTAVIGCGAIGSYLAESLARNGLEHIMLIDTDSLVVGNLTRHTLGIDDVGFNKNNEVKNRINQSVPHAKAEVMLGGFPPLEERSVKKLREVDIVLDCTASDKVLIDLARFDWGREKYFFSFSLGLNGKRMFAFFAKATAFPSDKFRFDLKQWLIFEKSTLGSEFPREGTGCWHSVFPARNDDILIFCASAVKFIEECLNGNSTYIFTTFEQVNEAGKFSGIRRRDEPV
ncbi:MAG TPA: ThiF family adenylyltransferase [Pseudobdellovibrionaceae bacterium]|jgi:hypothetical protein